jgi:hypothetical protein
MEGVTSTARLYLTRPPERAKTRSLPKRAPSDSLHPTLGEWPRLPFTKRIERAHSYRARSASKKGTWPLPSIFNATRSRHIPYQINTALPHRHMEDSDQAVCRRRPLNR